MTNDITITTPAGRTIQFSLAAAANIEETGLSDQIDTDVDGLVNGSGSLHALLGMCQQGATEDRFAGWDDYCHAIVRCADNEMLAKQHAAMS